MLATSMGMKIILMRKWDVTRGQLSLILTTLHRLSGYVPQLSGNIICRAVHAMLSLTSVSTNSLVRAENVRIAGGSVSPYSSRG